MTKYFDKVQRITECFLTRRKIKKYEKYKKYKSKKKNPILDWGGAFLWAAMVVLLINQYFFQAYQIPSGSMINTLLVGDRIFVNKMIYGPELIPGAMKIPGLFKPQRGEVIIFESPTYLSRGPIFTIVHRILHMLTLSLVDIDRDQHGEPRAQFLIKRAVGVGGDRIRSIEGNLYIRPAGAEHWIAERDFRQKGRTPAPVRRLISESEYALYRRAAAAMVYAFHNLTPLTSDVEAFSRLNSIHPSLKTLPDQITFNKYRFMVEYSIQPHNQVIRQNYRKHETGWFIPEGWIFPVGDNRDNSKDGRNFGPVRSEKVLGKALIKYWPLNRIGAIR
ncbi:MAG: signal peptidase I [Spirochaetes bacterium]|nr:signal peptidase I [Spirochaetota bacterium]